LLALSLWTLLAWHINKILWPFPVLPSFLLYVLSTFPSQSITKILQQRFNQLSAPSKLLQLLISVIAIMPKRKAKASASNQNKKKKKQHVAKSAPSKVLLRALLTFPMTDRLLPSLALISLTFRPKSAT